MTQAEIDPRSRFFNESDQSRSPFMHSGWRGGALDPDGFHHAKIPRFLFESIVLAAQPSSVLLRTYTPDSKSSVSLEPTWEAFRAHRFVRENWSLEYVLYDASGKWAVLLDPDCVTVGAEADLADRIDQELDEHGTGLVHLTNQFFPVLDPGRPYDRYVLAVMSGQPVGES